MLAGVGASLDAVAWRGRAAAAPLVDDALRALRAVLVVRAGRGLRAERIGAAETLAVRILETIGAEATMAAALIAALVEAVGTVAGCGTLAALARARARSSNPDDATRAERAAQRRCEHCLEGSSPGNRGGKRLGQAVELLLLQNSLSFN